MTTLSEQVSEMRALRPSRDGEPPNPFEAEQARLAATGVPEGVPPAGASVANVDFLMSTELPRRSSLHWRMSPPSSSFIGVDGVPTAPSCSARTRRSLSRPSIDTAPGRFTFHE